VSVEALGIRQGFVDTSRDLACPLRAPSSASSSET
jgi:hypothetical protein